MSRIVKEPDFARLKVTQHGFREGLRPCPMRRARQRTIISRRLLAAALSACALYSAETAAASPATQMAASTHAQTPDNAPLERPVAQTGTPDPKNARPLEGRPYISARETILSYGWKPFEGGCAGGGTSPEICASYSEIEYCSGTGQGFCSVKFMKPGRCLVIVTTGGPPGPDGSGDTRIEDVEFETEPCTADPQ